MKIRKLFLLCSIFTLSLVIAGCSSSNKSNSSDENYGKYPEKPIELIVPYPPGGGTDLVARTFVEHLNKHLPNDGKVVVVNKAGGGGVVGTTDFLKAQPDGHEILMIPVSVITQTPLREELAFDIDSFEPLARIATIRQMLLVKEDAPWNSYEEWLEYVKGNPGEFSYGTTATGGIQHLAMEIFLKEAGVEAKHVPFDGAGPMKTALQGGHIQGVVASIFASDRGTLRGLFSFSDAKGELTQDIPLLVDESGIEVFTDVIQALFVPKGTPSEIKEILNKAVKQTMEDPEFIEDFKKTELDLTYANAEELQDYLKEEREKLGQAMKDTGIID